MEYLFHGQDVHKNWPCHGPSILDEKTNNFDDDVDTVDGVYNRIPPVIEDNKSDLQNSYKIMFIDNDVHDDTPKTSSNDKKRHQSETEEMAYKVRILPETYEDINNSVSFQIRRQRLISDSSVNSEDSFIVFKGASESESEFEDEMQEDTDYESSSDDADDDMEAEIEDNLKKVQFNLQPTIHKIIHWNFAYRAARCGPWEQMARDRCRFQGKIYSIGHELDNILTPQHRNRIWMERFAPKN